MDGLQWKTLLKMDDLGVPLFLQTSIININYILDKAWQSCRVYKGMSS